MSLMLYDSVSQTIKVQDLKVNDEAAPFFDLPLEIQHTITNDSPLQRFISNPDAMDTERGEIVVELDGQDPITGNCMKKRFSYKSNEIVKDATFVGIIGASKDSDMEGYDVDLTSFHDMQISTSSSTGGNYGSAGGAMVGGLKADAGAGVSLSIGGNLGALAGQ